MQALHRIEPSTRIHLRTSVADWFVASAMRGQGPPGTQCDVPYTASQARLDVGIRQDNSLHQDIDGTLAACQALLERRDALVDEERAFLRRLRVDLVLSDIPAIPLAAAAREGIPAIAMSNFTWSWIYDRLAGEAPGLRRISDGFARDYAQADRLLRLPFHGGDAVGRVFRHVEDVPMVVRQATHAPDDTRRTLRLSQDDALVLVSFGGLGASHIDWAPLMRLDRYQFIVTPPASVNELPPDGPHMRLIDPVQLAAHDLHYADLVRACDVVVSKPGYGIVSECLAAGTRLLYTSRGQFAEYEVLVENIERHGVGAFISNEALERGAWETALDGLMARPCAPSALATNGAEVVARRLLELEETY